MTEYLPGRWKLFGKAAASARLNFEPYVRNQVMNSIYDAMLHGMRGAYRCVDGDLDTNKTDAEVIRRFGLEIIVHTGVSPDIGKLLSLAV